MKTKLMIGIGAALAIGLSACSKDEGQGVVENSAEQVALAGLVISEKPADAVSIVQLRKQAKAGDTVTFTGHALGSRSVFVDGRAVMIMGDPEVLISCSLIEGDNCSTPWDVCCEDPDEIKASIVTVQVLDGEGKIIKAGLKGVAGITELSDLTIVGEVAEKSTDDNMLINATAIYLNQ